MAHRKKDVSFHVRLIRVLMTKYQLKVAGAHETLLWALSGNRPDQSFRATGGSLSPRLRAAVHDSKQVYRKMDNRDPK